MLSMALRHVARAATMGAVMSPVIQQTVCAVSLQAVPALAPSLVRMLSSPPPDRVIPYKLADIGEGIAEVEVLQWYVDVGSKVNEFDNIVEVQSDKATVDISSRYDGIITKLHYIKGDMAQVGKPLVDINVGQADTPGVAAYDEALPESHAEEVLVEPQAPTLADTAPKKILATPVVRRLAKEKGIELDKVTGTGKGGRILKQDVLNFKGDAAPASTSQAATKPSPAAAGPGPAATTGAGPLIIKIAGIKRAMVKSMQESVSIPRFTHCDEFCVDELIKTRAALKPLAEKQGIRLSYLPFLLKAASLAALDHPQHNIGVAIDSPSGLIVPNIKNVQDKSIFEVASELNRLVELKDKIGPEDLTGGVFTLSNVGSFGGTYTSPIMMPNEVCIAALGSFKTTCGFTPSGQCYPTRVVNISWCGDHRVVDGATVAQASNAMKAFVEDPAAMLAVLR